MSEVTLREARFDEEDLSGMWALMRRLFGVPYCSCSLTDFVRMYRHKWLDNPARTPDHRLGWVLESPTDGIVGFVGLIPVRMKIGDGEIIGASGTSYGVLPAYRASSLSLYMREMDWGERHLLVDTTSSQVGNYLYTRLKRGMTKIPVKEFDRQFLWLIQPEVPIKWMLDKSAWRIWSALAARAPLAWLLKAVARIRFVRHRWLRFPDATLPVEPVKAFTEEYTQFWDAHKHEYGVTTVRDRTFLQWRHLDAPAIIGATHVFACRDNGRLRGYLALMERHRQEGYCPGHFRVIDVFYDRSRPDVVFSLLNHTFEFAKERGCSVFEVSRVSEELAALLRSQRPYVRQADSWAYWYKAPTTELAEVCQRATWWPSGVDGEVT